MSEQVMDIEEFLDRVQQDKELLVELLDIFTEDFGVKKDLLKSAIDSKNFEEIGSIAHSLKGAAGNISAKDLRETMLVLEEKGKAQDGEGLDALYDDMMTKFAALSSRMEEVKSEMAS